MSYLFQELRSSGAEMFSFWCTSGTWRKREIPTVCLRVEVIKEAVVFKKLIQKDASCCHIMVDYGYGRRLLEVKVRAIGSSRKLWFWGGWGGIKLLWLMCLIHSVGLRRIDFYFFFPGKEGQRWKTANRWKRGLTRRERKRLKSCILLASSCYWRPRAATLLFTYSEAVVCSGPVSRETGVGFGRAGADVAFTPVPMQIRHVAFYRSG